MRRAAAGLFAALAGLAALPFVPAGIAPPLLRAATPLLTRAYAYHELGAAGGERCLSPDNYAYDPRTTLPDHRLVPEPPEQALAGYLAGRMATPDGASALWKGFDAEWVEIGNHNTNGVASVRVALHTIASEAEERVFVLRAARWQYVWLDIGSGDVGVDRFLCTAGFRGWQVEGELVPGVVAPSAIPLSRRAAPQ